jgi:hypothetical protein
LEAIILLHIVIKCVISNRTVGNGQVARKILDSCRWEQKWLTDDVGKKRLITGNGTINDSEEAQTRIGNRTVGIIKQRALTYVHGPTIGYSPHQNSIIVFYGGVLDSSLAAVSNSPSGASTL